MFVLIDVVLVSVLCLWKNELWGLFVCLGLMALMSYLRTKHFVSNTDK